MSVFELKMLNIPKRITFINTPMTGATDGARRHLPREFRRLRSARVRIASRALTAACVFAEIAVLLLCLS